MLRLLRVKGRASDMFSVLRRETTRVANWALTRPIRAVLALIAAIAILEYLSLPNLQIQELGRMNPRRTALMEQREREARASGKALNVRQSWVSLSRISPDLVHAVIVSEDGTFFQHSGVDWYEVEESIEKDIEEGKVARGGSTISQQLAKNLYLSTSRDPFRKLKELILALRMERMLPKRRILEIYLNVIEWGNGVFGAEAAAQKYFGKHAAELTRQEAVEMAAVIPSPLRSHPNQPSAYIERRASLILERMNARGY